MQVTSRTHLQASLQNTIFIGLLVIAIVLIAWLSTHYEIKADWTVNNRHTLSEASQKLLAQFPDSITITAYASNNSELRSPIKELVERYQRHKSNIKLRFVDPFTVPGEVRERGIQVDGEILIDYQTRTEHVRPGYQPLSEQVLTSALQRVARTDTRQIVFLGGHGERSPTKFTDQELSKWAQGLKDIGFEVQTLNFGEQAKIPASVRVLVIANPQTKLLPGEVTLIIDYIDKGGNLLWLLEPNVSLQGLEPLAAKFGLTMQSGIIVDPVSRLFGINDPAIVSVTTAGYSRHPVTAGLEEHLTIFPQVGGLIIDPSDELWNETGLLATNPQAWSETGKVEGTVEYDDKTDIGGPLDIAFALVRDKVPDDSETDMADELGQPPTSDLDDNLATDTTKKLEITDTGFKTEAGLDANTDEPVSQEQRVIIVGDGDYLSNSIVQFGGNLDLGIKMMNWLALDDSFVQIPTKTAVDLSLELSPNLVIFLGIFFLFILPLGLVITGISIWLHRRKA